MNILIIAPHQDDEVLSSSGLIQKSIKLGDTITVLFATNGDYHGPYIAQQRFYESKKALKFLGVEENNIFYLGYGDTGMNYSHSFLRRLLLTQTNTSLFTPVSSITYHPAGRKTVRAIRLGADSSLTQENFLKDLKWFINRIRPDMIIVPNARDLHGDHASIIPLLHKIDVLAQIPICLTYIIHGGNDTIWPTRNTKLFTRPPVISIETWESRVSIPLNNLEQKKKTRAILTFMTQLEDDSNNFLSAFSKQEEIYFLLKNDTINQQKIYNHFVNKGNP